MAKKKKNNRPAKKRDRGTTIQLDRNFNENKKFNNTRNISSKNNNQNVNQLYYVPYDTSKVINEEKIQNFALHLNKLKIHNFEKKDKFPNIWSPKYKTDNYYKQLKSNFEHIEIDLQIEDKLIIGLGSASVYETSLTLHHIYGVPYIPGSSIKGSFRSYIIQERFDNDEDKALKSDWFIKLFGSQEKQGNVIFFDAFSENVEIKKDIMNPHYPDYYDGKTYPTDTQNPRPINFLVCKGTFKFIFGIQKDFEVKDKNIAEWLEENFKKAMKEFGIGAKTAVGYGYFKE
jgi:CRISPR-associated protein Cmr6